MLIVRVDATGLPSRVAGVYVQDLRTGLGAVRHGLLIGGDREALGPVRALGAARSIKDVAGRDVAEEVLQRILIDGAGKVG